MVDGKAFRKWLIYPLLGDYRMGEPNSIVIMDNASMHMSHEVRDMICERGVCLLYTAPYSPVLFPIEYAFNVYKSHLKRWSKDFDHEDWFLLHKKALNKVSRDIAIKEFRRCEIPFSHEVLTSDEMLK